MVTFTDFIYRLQYFGVADVLLPFILIFTIVFAILQKTEILGKVKDSSGQPTGVKRYNVIVALVLGFGVVIPHVLGWYPPNADVVNIINAALPNVSIILVALLAVFLIIGLMGGTASWAGSATGWVALIAFLVVAFIFGNAAGWFNYWPSWLWWLRDPDTQAMIIIFAVFAIIIWYIAKEPKQPNEPGAWDNFIDSIGGLVGRNNPPNRPPG